MYKKASNFLKLFLGDNPERHQRILHTLKAKANAKRTAGERLADNLTEHFGSIGFLLLNAVWFVAWILINTGTFQSIPIFDPFPFSLLTMIVSLEAIILAIFVLISQNRAAKIDDIREETHLQINLISEKEITKILKMVSVLLEKNGINLEDDPELKKMLEPVSEDALEKILEKEMS